MQRYANKGGDSGVVAYEIGDGFIIVEFSDGSRYKYTNRSVGETHFRAMLRLAKEGEGLNAYINTNQKVRKGYSSRKR